MASGEAERLLIEIGRLLAQDTEYPLDGTLLYAELDDNMVAPSIFKDRGNHILYRRPDLDRVGDALLDLWETQTAEPRWVEIEYVVRGDTFDATYTYPDEIPPVSPDEGMLDRRARIVARHFGNKPIVYPPWDNDDGVPQYTL